MSIKRVVIATDGSPSAQMAVEAGLDLASSTGAEVTFVHIAGQVTDRLYREDPRHPPSEERIESADAILQHAVARATARGLQASAELFAGIDTQSIADAILGVAAARSADVIVVGCRGRGVVAGTLLGSVSRHVLKDAQAPVLVVPPG